LKGNEYVFVVEQSGDFAASTISVSEGVIANIETYWAIKGKQPEM
jgi:hypothetical protein